MPLVFEKHVWEALEDKLLAISESRSEDFCWEARVAVATIVSAGRDCDLDFLEKPVFKSFCNVAKLDPDTTAEIITHTIRSVRTKGLAALRRSIVNGD